MKYRSLNIKGTVLDNEQLQYYLEKVASDHVLKNTSDKDTYPIPKLKENYEIIKEIYNLLNEHIKMGIPIHPAGEWLLDNFYIIEETIKTAIKELPLKKYTSFLGISNGTYKGFARIYVLASEIVAYTDNKIDSKNVSELLNSYQKKKTLSMEEIWNIGLFIQIALIQNIRDICEKIYFSQMQKYRVENIIERLVENKEELKYKNLSEYKAKVKGYGEMKYPFIEYMSYRLKKYGKSALSFVNILEEQVNKMGTTIDEVIQKEHFDIAVKKVSMANCITSIKELLRIDFLQIFEKINGVEEILRKDPAHIYEKMDYKTKEYYRNKIKEISKKTKISELYIAQKVLELAENKLTDVQLLNQNANEAKQQSKINKCVSSSLNHVGYYLIDEGENILLDTLQVDVKKKLGTKAKFQRFLTLIWGTSIFVDILVCLLLELQIKNIFLTIFTGVILLLPIQEFVQQIVKHIMGKVVKPKLIPKLDFQNGVPKEAATFIVVPTIVKSKEKVIDLMKHLEVYYLANKSENLYFALLGDCSSGKNKEEPFDKEVEEEGIRQVKLLNEKYKVQDNEMPKFTFIYRKRFWNGKEECYLGWERKRGLLNQFNEYILGKEENVFKVNTLEDWRKQNENNQIEDIKYIITLDADTQLTLNTGLELIGAMEHPLNIPILNEKRDLVIKGHALIQPRVGIDLEASIKTLFTKIFAGTGGTDSYTNAISDIYQDNFEEGIFTGKGIYNLKVFSEVLNNEIPENTVLSHDLLEGSYLRCALATDIMLLDGYPANYNSFKSRQHRWIRGDFQIVQWLKKYIIDKKENKKINPLNKLSKYKIFDNLVRALTPILIIILFILAIAISAIYKISSWQLFLVASFAVFIPMFIDIVNKIVYRKEGQDGKKNFSPTINSFLASILRGFINLSILPDSCYNSLDAITKTIYRMHVSQKHMLEWTTSEEAEKLAKTDLKSYYLNMIPNIVLGLIGLVLSFTILKNVIAIAITVIVSVIWLIAPIFMWFIGKKVKENKKIEELEQKDREYIFDIGQKTWKYFKDTLIKENNYLPPDNYQEDRTPKLIPRTSSTNIGLAMLAVISSYDLGYENLEDTLKLLNEMLQTIQNLPKWNGHLYNWYDIKTLQPLIPRYISTVDSGNFIGYVYIVKQFLEEVKQEQQKNNIEYLDNLIKQTDFKTLYDEEKRLFSIGYNIEENKLTDSYYDLLASEARQASLVAIAKKDVSPKHWYNLSRTLTTLNGYKGLISWSGTAFEYLMPNINIKNYKGSLLDESCNFMIMSQKEYARKLGIPWGFSETAFNVKDLNNNYQYKAIGIPWLGLKRGLEEDVVISTYASCMALSEIPKEVIDNLKELEKEQMYGKYGFYESVDYTLSRLKRKERYAVVKTYMAHHQALILLSINNLFNEKILQRRFHNNPEIEAVDILLQERMPESVIITKEQKEKPSKIKYIDYENYAQRVITKLDTIKLQAINVRSNGKYTVVTNEHGRGYSKYKDILINRYKSTSDEEQGIIFYIKNIKNKKIWSSKYAEYLSKPDKIEVTFTEDMDKITRIDGAIETTIKSTISSEKAVEIRNIKLKNTGLEDETLEITSLLEPVLSKDTQDYAHPAFNNLFLVYEYLEDTNTILVKRKDRSNSDKDIYMAVNFYTNNHTIGDLEYEVDKEKLYGRGNLEVPNMIKFSRPFSKKIDLSTDPIVAMKRTILIKPGASINLSLIIAISEDKHDVINTIKEYCNCENINRTFELSTARIEAENRYLGVNYRNILEYQKMLGYLLFTNPLKQVENIEKEQKYSQSELWKYGISGDLPILFVKIASINDIYVLEDVLKAYEFYRAKNIEIDLIILNKEPNSYESYVKEEILNSILNKGLGYMQNIKGGIFILENIEDEELFDVRANLVIDAKNGTISRQLKDMEEEYIENQKDIGYEPQKINIMQEEKISKPLDSEELKYYNEYGGFSKDGKEYLIRVNKENRVPTVWSNVLTNENFGTIVTESLGGFTWGNANSRLNRITSWSNNQIVDIPSEIIYMQDKENLKTWSLGLNPMPDDNDYYITYGFGYAKYMHTSSQIVQNLTVYVAKNENIKINLLNLKNLEPKKRKVKLVYYIKPVLGEDELKLQGFMDVKFNKNTNILEAKNLANEDFKDVIYISSSEKIEYYTANKEFFIGKGNLANPEALKRVGLNNESNISTNEILAIQIEIELEAFESKDISILLGIEKNELDCQDRSYKYCKIGNCINELEEVQKYWQNIVKRVEVKTPMESFNILLNGWAVYQTIASRLWARSGFYQSGGAYGFRDQLQDTLALKYIEPEYMKKQIIKHSKHQFIEGDVEHWWHDTTSRGIRTRFSDDLLWLVYLVEEYISFTGDYSILDEITPYRKGEVLDEGVDEKYDLYIETEEKGSIYEHCLKSIEKALNFGENGLPKIGSGDWNDGFSTVGNKGRGESVWLGFFMYDILNKWLPIMEKKMQETNNEDKNIEKDVNKANENLLNTEQNSLNLIEKYKRIIEELRRALNTKAWDGRWYRRAFTDNGEILGTIGNEECRIDGISQSWATISNAGDNDKKYISMESLENHLIDRENGIIKLLDPPFEKSKLEPGYIKAYLPGTRENGGQYTHAAIWAIIAEAKLGFGEKAVELFRMINPIEHSRTKEAANKYKVEPYVIAADIYGHGNLAGRGGWTWYTGSSSWMQVAGIEYILGLKIEKGVLKLKPCIPKDWKEYFIRYRYGNTVYNITVKNNENAGTINNTNEIVKRFLVDGKEIEEKQIVLQENGGIIEVEVYI